MSQSILIVIVSMTGRAQAKEGRGGIVQIMITVGCMQVDAILRTGSAGDSFRPLCYVTELASPVCLLFTVPG